MSTTIDQSKSLQLRVSEADSRDVGRGLVRIDPSNMELLGVRSGDVVLIQGEKSAVGKVLPMRPELRGSGRLQMDGLLRQSSRSSVDSNVTISVTSVSDCSKVRFQCHSRGIDSRDLDLLKSLLLGVPIQVGSIVRATLFGNESIDLEVTAIAPNEPCLIGEATTVEVESSEQEGKRRNLSYEDVGGARHQLQKIREMVELPLKYPEVFQRLGIDPPRGVLLYGPPGCGKTLIARAIAHETDASFFTISGPEIIHKHYGESEAHLRNIFQEASKKSPSIIFLDEIDAIAPKRENAAGDVERRVVAQLLTLMDGLKRRENVIVIAATNLPNAIDPALRRPGRFDREIEIAIPDRNGRRNILEIHTRGMPIDFDVQLDHLAAITHGFVGADLEALCREAAMNCIRRLFDRAVPIESKISVDQLSRMTVSMLDFMQGFQAVEPSAVREVSVEVPSVRWEDVGGLAHIKQQLMESLIWPIQYASLFDVVKVKPPRGLLLSGPPGCGKTLIAKAAATESGINFISVKGPELLSKFVGDSEKRVREVFSKARQAAPCLVFFDEIDGLCTTRESSDGESGVSARVLSQLLAEMDGVEELKGVFVLAATNRVDRVDPALKRFGRFEKTVQVGLPDADSRKAILEVHLRDRPLQGALDWDEWARKTEGFSGADIASLCSTAARNAIRRYIERTGNNQMPAELQIEIIDLEEAWRVTAKGTQ